MLYDSGGESFAIALTMGADYRAALHATTALIISARYKGYVDVHSYPHKRVRVLLAFRFFLFSLFSHCVNVSISVVLSTTETHELHNRRSHYVQ